MSTEPQYLRDTPPEFHDGGRATFKGTVRGLES
jgi:hypothetical protein